jgi:hypothetical protein
MMTAQHHLYQCHGPTKVLHPPKNTTSMSTVTAFYSKINMKDKKIDAYLIQETHLAGDFEKSLTFDYYIIHHGS